jgi:glycosyltransferase involved in cell wall biosynthesis
MHICLVSEARIPVKNYGGTERIVQWLAKELVRMGHQVSLVAQPSSSLPGVTCFPARNAHQALLAVPQDADFVHFHGWAPSEHYSKPWVYTLHGNTNNLHLLPLHTVGISSDHAIRHGLRRFVYNGIDPEEFIFKQSKHDFLLFFSKVRRRVKGARRALELAKKFRQKMVFAGGNRLDLLKVGGFMDSLNRDIRFMGEIGGVEKANCFADAKALVFPIDWDEPFGLVMIEALMSGTPVIATPRGSVPELITDVVGALFEKDDEFEQALEHALSCSPMDCREYAVSKFSSKKCAENYVALYEDILNGDTRFR